MSIEIVPTNEMRKEELVRIEKKLSKTKGVKSGCFDLDLFSYPVKQAGDPDGVEIERHWLNFNIRFSRLTDVILAYNELIDSNLSLGVEAGIKSGVDLDHPPYMNVYGKKTMFCTHHVSCKFMNHYDLTVDVQNFMDAAGVLQEFRNFEKIKENHLVPLDTKWKKTKGFDSYRELITGGENVYSERLFSEGNGSGLTLDLFSENIDISDFLNKIKFEYDYAYLKIDLKDLGTSGNWEKRGSVYEIINSFRFSEMIVEILGEPSSKSVSELIQTGHADERGERRMFGYSIRGIGKGSILLEYQGGKGKFLFHMEKESSGRSYGKLIEFVNSLSPCGDIVDLDPI